MMKVYTVQGKKILSKQLCSLNVQRSFHFLFGSTLRSICRFSFFFFLFQEKKTNNEENFSHNLLIGKQFLYRVKADVMHIILLRW